LCLISSEKQYQLRIKQLEKRIKEKNTDVESAKFGKDIKKVWRIQK
jgi:hypothetical protein